jgi:hypothetical protein
LKAAFEAQSPFLAFKDDIAAIRHTKLREEVEMNMKDNDNNSNSCKRNKYNLLNPPFVFYAFIYTFGIIIVWLCSGLFVGVYSSELKESLIPGIFFIPFICAFIATITIITFNCVLHYLYLRNIRMAFKNAFLPKINVPNEFKQVNFPEGYKYDDLKSIFDKVHQEYASKSLQANTRDGGFQKPTKLTQILGYETPDPSLSNDNKNIEESKIYF